MAAIHTAISLLAARRRLRYTLLKQREAIFAPAVSNISLYGRPWPPATSHIKRSIGIALS